MINDVIINEIFAGSFSKIAGYIASLCEYLWYIGMILFAYKFIYMVVKKEIGALEDIWMFAFTKGSRLLLLSVFWLPLSLPGIDTSINGNPSPLGFSLLYMGAQASFASADELSKSTKGVPFLQLPTVFAKDTEQGQRNIEETYKDFLSKDMVTEEQRSWLDDSIGGHFVKYLGSAFSMYGSILTSDSPENILKKTQTAMNASKDLMITGDQSLAVVVRDFIMSLLLPATVILTFYGTLISLLAHFVISSLFFFLSAFMLFFDSKKQVFYDNLIKVASLILSPFSLVISYLTAEQLWIVFHKILEKYIFQAMRAGDVGLITHLIVAIIISFTFMAIIIKIFSTMHNFISNMLGSAFHAGL